MAASFVPPIAEVLAAEEKCRETHPDVVALVGGRGSGSGGSGRAAIFTAAAAGKSAAGKSAAFLPSLQWQQRLRILANACAPGVQ